jgi:hypothetical protein
VEYKGKITKGKINGITKKVKAMIPIIAGKPLLVDMP